MTPRLLGVGLLVLGLAVPAVSGCAQAPTDGATSSDSSSYDSADVVPLEAEARPELPVSVRSVGHPDVEVIDVSRIVPLEGGLAEIVFSLGLGDSVVGRDVSATFEAADGLPVVTQAHDVSAEGVLSLRPTVVLADPTTGPPEVMDQIRAAGVPVVVVAEAWTIDAIAPRIRHVADALGVDELGDELVARTNGEIETAAARAPDDGRPLTVAFLYVRGTAGVYLMGGRGSGADAMLEAIGARDAGAEAALGTFTPLTSEALVAAAPDVVLVMSKALESVGGVDGLLALPGVAQTPAGRERRVVTVEDGLLLGFGPRTGAALDLLAQGLYGGQQ